MFFSAFGSVEAQQPTKIPWIGYLAGSGLSFPSIYARTARSRHVEGKNIGFWFRTTEGKNERYSISRRVGPSHVDIIVAGNTGVLAAKKATSSIPIVHDNIGAPVGLGLVASLASPAQYHGFVSNVPGSDWKTLELLKETLPRANE